MTAGAAHESEEQEDVKLDDRSDDYGLIAIQGPRSVVLLSELTSFSLFQMDYYHFERGKVAGCEAMVSRTGYTGEDGFEIMCDKDEVQIIWDALMTKGASHNIQACGLGARDSLRIEACMALYGHELNDETSVLEAGLSYFCKLDKPEMVGLEALRAQKENGRERKLVNFRNDRARHSSPRISHQMRWPSGGRSHQRAPIAYARESIRHGLY